MTIVTNVVFSAEVHVRVFDPSVTITEYGDEWLVCGDYDCGVAAGFGEWCVWAPSEFEAWLRAAELLFGASA